MSKKAVIISSIASNQGKTLLTAALLSHFKKNVRAFKIGPDFIDPIFHEKITKRASINLDIYICSKEGVKWLFEKYAKDFSIIEGVMGYYDGMDKNSSAYDISKLLNIPVILVLDASGSYITLSAVIKGIREFKKDNLIKGVVLNRVSSKSHYEMIKREIKRHFSDIEILGWIKKDLLSINSRYLGLDLRDIDKIENLSKRVLENIDIDKIYAISNSDFSLSKSFSENRKIDKKAAIVKDRFFSFLYQDNVEYLKELFREVVFVSAEKDERIPKDCDFIFLPGGYVESDEAYEVLKKSKNFQNSLKEAVKNKSAIYAECAGLLYLSNRVDDKKMSSILDMDFTLTKKRVRLGYYYINGIKGHAFHYSKPINPKKGEILYKEGLNRGEVGAWREGRVYATYLHTMFRFNKEIIWNLL